LIPIQQGSEYQSPAGWGSIILRPQVLLIDQ
jgi:hypothetical protein